MQNLSSIHTLVTGATGFVGLRTVSKLLMDTPIPQVTLAIRAKCQQSAESRFMSLMKQHPQLAIQNNMDRIQVIPYNGKDIPVLVDSSNTKNSSFDALLNLGADTSWTKPLDEMMMANCLPLSNLIEKGKMPRYVVHCSSAFSCPLEAVSVDQIAKEESFPEGKTFFSPYAESKYHAERIIERDVQQQLERQSNNSSSNTTCYSIVRPATVGASTGMDGLPRGWQTDLKGLSGFFYIAHPWLGASKSIHTHPAKGGYASNIISVDHVANTLIAALCENVLRGGSSRSSSGSIEYIHAAPGHGQDKNWAEVTKAVNPNFPINWDDFEDEMQKKNNDVDGRAVPGQFSHDRKVNEICEILGLVVKAPFQFAATKRETLLKPLLSAEEQERFPMAWADDQTVASVGGATGDNREAYFKDCSNVVAFRVAKREATKTIKKMGSSLVQSIWSK